MAGEYTLYEEVRLARSRIRELEEQAEEAKKELALETERAASQAGVLAWVAEREGMYTPKDEAPRLHYCPNCDPLNPWNESDNEHSGPTREQFTHEPGCGLAALKALASDKQAIRQPGLARTIDEAASDASDSEISPQAVDMRRRFLAAVRRNVASLREPIPESGGADATPAPSSGGAAANGAAAPSEPGRKLLQRLEPYREGKS